MNLLDTGLLSSDSLSPWKLALPINQKQHVCSLLPDLACDDKGNVNHFLVFRTLKISSRVRVQQL